MKPQINSSIRITTPTSSNKYLKPGALARLRNSKISARSHVLMLRRVNSLLSSLQSQTPSPQTPPQVGGSLFAQIESVDQLPQFPAPINGPPCIGRKKFAAPRSSAPLVHVSGREAGSGRVPESSPGSLIVSVVNSDLLVH